MSPKKKKATPIKDISPTVKIEKIWMDAVEKVIGHCPDYNYGKDRMILKGMIDRHGEGLVIEKALLHASGGKMLTVGGFKTMFNDLGNNGVKKFETFDERNEREIREWTAKKKKEFDEQKAREELKA